MRVSGSRYLSCALAAWAALCGLAAVGAAQTVRFPTGLADVHLTDAETYPNGPQALAVPVALFLLVVAPLLLASSGLSSRWKSAGVAATVAAGGAAAFVVVTGEDTSGGFELRGDAAFGVVVAAGLLLLGVLPPLVRAMTGAVRAAGARRPGWFTAAAVAALLAGSVAAVAVAPALPPFAAAVVATLPACFAALALRALTNRPESGRFRRAGIGAVVVAVVVAVAAPVVGAVAIAHGVLRAVDELAVLTAENQHEALQRWPGPVWVHRDLDVLSSYPHPTDPASSDEPALVSTTSYPTARHGVSLVFVSTTRKERRPCVARTATEYANGEVVADPADEDPQAWTPPGPRGRVVSVTTTTCVRLDGTAMWTSVVERDPDGVFLDARNTVTVPAGHGWRVHLIWSAAERSGSTRTFAQQLTGELVRMSRDEVSVAELVAYKRDAFRGAGISAAHVGRRLGAPAYVPAR